VPVFDTVAAPDDQTRPAAFEKKRAPIPGSNDQVRFELPKGSYVPVIRTISSAERLRVSANQ